ncbi:hypothetical protein [Streptomyces sp. NPDC090022]|uniref:hypothetical protein n=1 Tax=Streptomyces sp. NPDC090022 TaxID=3365920 RepID=UPI00382CF070
MTDTTPAPAVGQIWQDNDKRGFGRRIRIDSIDGTHARVTEVSGRDHSPVLYGRATRIRLDRFRPTSTGYRYIGTA